MANNRRYFECGAKVRHTSQRLADKAARKAEAKYGDGPMLSYRCSFCKCWHTAHAERKKDPLDGFR